jgi:hypothetical protein
MRAKSTGTLTLVLASACGGAAPGVEPDGMSAASAVDATSEPAADAGVSDDAAPDSTWDDGPRDAAHADVAREDPSPLEAGADASLLSDASQTSDAAHTEAGPVADAGPKECVYLFAPDYAFCNAAGVLGVSTPILMQDTAQGARGDCAVHASGPGGRNLYYRYSAPAGRDTLVVATAKRAGESAVVRVLTRCDADKAEAGQRGATMGDASVCVSNRKGAEREVIIAVARYSGEAHDATLLFDLSATLLPEGSACGF